MNLRPEIKTGTIDNVFFRMLYFKQKDEEETIPKLQHGYIMLLASGSISIKTNKTTTTYSAPNIFSVDNKKQHSISSEEEDTVVYSFHTLKDKDGCILQKCPVNAQLNDLGIDEFLL